MRGFSYLSHKLIPMIKRKPFVILAFSWLRTEGAIVIVRSIDTPLRVYLTQCNTHDIVYCEHVYEFYKTSQDMSMTYSFILEVIDT